MSIPSSAAAHRGVSFEAVDSAAINDLSVALASMEPWRTLGISSSTLTRLLTQPDDHLRRHAIAFKGNRVGAVALRTPWLYGPYIALLAILPDFQGRGIGSAVLR